MNPVKVGTQLSGEAWQAACRMQAGMHMQFYACKEGPRLSREKQLHQYKEGYIDRYVGRQRNIRSWDFIQSHQSLHMVSGRPMLH